MTAVTQAARILPLQVAPERLAGLPLQAGQTVTAKVVEVLPGGTVRLQLAGSQIDARAQVPLQVGSNITLRAVVEAGLLKLLLVPGNEAGAVKPAAGEALGARPQAALALPSPQTGTPQAQASLASIPRPAISPQPLPQIQLPPAAGAAQVQTGAASSHLDVQQLAARLGEPVARLVQQTLARGAQGGAGDTAVQAAPHRALLASLVGGLAQSAAQEDGPLPELLRQAAGQLLGLKPQPAPQSSTVSPSPVTQGTPEAVTQLRPAVATLLSSLAQTVAQADGALPDVVRQAAAKLLDLQTPAPQSATGPAATSGGVQARFAHAAGLFDLAGKLAADQSVPAQVRAAAEQVLALRLPLEKGVSADAIRQATLASGLLHEAKLVQLLPGATPLLDMKGALLLLRNVLQSWLGTEQSGTANAGQAGKGAPPPLPGAPADAATTTAKDLARALLAQSDATLARIRVGQVAALPDRADSSGHAQAARGDSVDLNFQIPLSDGGRNLVAQFQIERDGTGAEAEEAPAWRVRFYLDFDPIGATHTLVALRGKRIDIKLRSERRETSTLFQHNEDVLVQMLEDAGLEVENVDFSTGPVQQPLPGAGQAGSPHMVDRRT